MKVLKLEVNYDGYYGGSVSEYCLLPLDVNGVLFEQLETGEYERVVYLGEIEGKHSEVYGDLTVKIIDLDDLSVQSATSLINSSSIGEFECYFEGIEDEHREILEDEGVSYDEKIKPIVDRYEVKLSTWSIITVKIYEKFIEELKSKYVIEFKTITVLEDDYDHAMSVLHNSNIETF